MSKYNSERDAALQTLDRSVIEGFMRKWGLKVHEHDTVFWGVIHKAITGSIRIPMKIRKKSKRWLTKHKMEFWDDGDL